jgi:hypothetical protein
VKKVRGSMPTIISILHYWNSDESKENTKWRPTNAKPIYYDDKSYKFNIQFCMICGETTHGDFVKLERSHLHSCDMDGSNHPSNLVIACRSCNIFMPSCCDKFRALKFLDESLFFNMRKQNNVFQFGLMLLEGKHNSFLRLCEKQRDLFDDNERSIFKQQSQTQVAK